MASLVATPRIWRHEHRLTGPDGRKYWMEWADTPIFDADGRLVEFQSVGLDISDRKETELDRKSTRLNSSHTDISRMPSSA